MNNRVPVFVLAGLVFVALLWRLANPPAPPSPGPAGTFPGWRSTETLGALGGSAVNPAGSAWAGAWNVSGKDETGRSAVWVLDFSAYQARLCELEGAADVTHLSWQDDDTIRVLRPDSNDTVAYIDAKTAKVKNTVGLDVKVTSVLCWPAMSDEFVAQLQSSEGRLSLAVLSVHGDAAGEPIELPLPRGGKLVPEAAMSPDGTLVVFSIAHSQAAAGRAYYLGDTADSSARKLFDLGDLPGKAEAIWVNESQVLVACSERDTFSVAVCDLETGKVTPAPKGESALKAWPDVQNEMLFVTYNGGYKLNLAEGRAKKLFDLTKLSDREGIWREAVRDGRLYEVSDHYVSVSLAAGAIDIREIKKDGTAGRRILARF